MEINEINVVVYVDEEGREYALLPLKTFRVILDILRAQEKTVNETWVTDEHITRQ